MQSGEATREFKEAKVWPTLLSIFEHRIESIDADNHNKYNNSNAKHNIFYDTRLQFSALISAFIKK